MRLLVRVPAVAAGVHEVASGRVDVASGNLALVLGDLKAANHKHDDVEEAAE